MLKCYRNLLNLKFQIDDKSKDLTSYIYFHLCLSIRYKFFWKSVGRRGYFRLTKTWVNTQIIEVFNQFLYSYSKNQYLPRIKVRYSYSPSSKAWCILSPINRWGFEEEVYELTLLYWQKYSMHLLLASIHFVSTSYFFSPTWQYPQNFLSILLLANTIEPFWKLL